MPGAVRQKWRAQHYPHPKKHGLSCLQKGIKRYGIAYRNRFLAIEPHKQGQGGMENPVGQGCTAPRGKSEEKVSTAHYNQQQNHPAINQQQLPDSLPASLYRVQDSRLLVGSNTVSSIAPPPRAS